MYLPVSSLFDAPILKATLTPSVPCPVSDGELAPAREGLQ